MKAEIKNMKSRVAYFDQMKAVAIILVVMGHIVTFALGMNETDLNRWLNIPEMPVFFLISGYFAYKVLNTRREVKTQLWKKIHTVAIPLLVWCGIVTFIYDGETWIHMLSRCGGKYWFLYTLTILSVFFVLYEQLVKRVKNPWLYTVLWVLPFMVLVVAKVKSGGVNTWFPVDSLVNYYRYYLVGFLCRKYARLNDVLFHNPVCYAIAFVAFALQFIFEDRCYYVLIFLGAMGAIIMLEKFFASFDEEANKNSRVLRWLTYLGTKTLPVYLIHYFFIPDMKQYGEVLSSIGNPFIIHLAVCLLLTLCIIAVSLCVERLIAMNKYLAWLMLGKETK